MAINCEATTHVIDGVTYVEVDRKAEVGDMVWLANVKCGLRLSGYNDIAGVNEDIIRGDVKMLEPLQTEASPDVIDLLTSLSRKIVSLESQLRDTQNNVEKQAIELANTRHRIAKHADRFAAIEDKVEMLIDDVVALDSRSQVLNAINKYYAEGSR